VSTGSRGTVLLLSGELDLSSAAALEDELQRVGDLSLVIVDLTGLAFIDSTGLGVLVRAHQRMHEHGNLLALVQGEGQVSRLLQLTGLADDLTVIGDAQELLGEY